MQSDKTHVAVPNHDGEEFHPVTKFYTLEGPCKKCSSAPNSLVIVQHKHNVVDRGESIFKTRCLACGVNDTYRAKNISMKGDK